MISNTTIARPYAHAIVELAQKDNSFIEWSEQLQFLALVAEDPRGKGFFKNLAILPEEKAEFICSLTDGLTGQSHNLVKLLADAKRLLILPDLYEFYEKLRRKVQQQVTVNLTVGQDTNSSEIKDLAASIKGEVSVDEKLNKDLIAGGVLQLGNRVVDGSFLGRLRALRETLIS